MLSNNQVEPSINRHVDFIRSIINDDLRTNKYGGKVITRFPPEPNGFLHIGHAKSICINFGIALDYNGICHLRMDDTDPTKENITYVESIMQDVKWLGFDWNNKLFYASDYFERIYQYAVDLVKMGKAYVCSLNEHEIREYRGTVTIPGKESPYKSRSIEENLDLFTRMHNGEFKDGEHVLRAKIDMSSPNMKMRDPLIYRIRHAEHYRAGNKWCIYPLYDFAHCISDYIEGITHSICTLEFENNRELYEWYLEELGIKDPRPHQHEFARLNLNYTVMSKRKLLDLVENKLVCGWDDPRLPTISGLRKRGYTPEAIRKFCDTIGIAKANSTVDMAQLEFCVRDDLNPKVPRILCVLNPLKVVIDNYPADKTEILEASYYPHDVPKVGSRALPFSKEIYIERDDFMENPTKDYYRLAPGKEVRLRHAYIIKCEKVIKDEKTGEILELHCSYDPDTKSGNEKSNKNVKGIIHWLSVKDAVKTTVRLYDRLYTLEFPETLTDGLNPNSLTVLNNAYVEPSILNDKPGSRYQFERLGYFYYDPDDSINNSVVFNRIVNLRDSWTKIAKIDETKKPVPLKEPTNKVKLPKPAQTKTIQLSKEVEYRLKEYTQKYGMSEDDALIIAKDESLSSFFEKAVSIHNNPKSITNWIVNELLRELKEKSINSLLFGVNEFADLVILIDNNTISGKIAKDVFNEMLLTGHNPKAIVQQKGLLQINDSSQIEPIIDKLIKANPENVTRYKEGKSNVLGFFVGQVLKETKGKANPKLVNDLILKKLSGN